MMQKNNDLNIGFVDLEKDIQSFLDELTKRRISKREEYTKGSYNGFHNFVVAANLNNSLPEVECHNFMTKHLVSYLDMIEQLKNGTTYFPEAVVDEKIGDIITYLLLWRSMIRETNGYINQEELPF